MPQYHYENGVCEPHFENYSAKKLQASSANLWTGGTTEGFKESALVGHILL